LKQDLASMGLSLRGFEVRSWKNVQKGDFPSPTKEGESCPKTTN
jgi:hypothetical protein